MKLGTFLRFYRQIRGKKPVDIDAIQSMGLLAVKLGQIFALRPDLIDPARCIELQQLYSRAATIPEEDSQRLLDRFAPEGFMDHFEHLDMKPFAAASIGQYPHSTHNWGNSVLFGPTPPSRKTPGVAAILRPRGRRGGRIRTIRSVCEAT